VPCNTIQRSKVEFLAAVTDASLLVEALRSLGFSDVVRQGELVLFRTATGAGNFHKGTGKMIQPQSCDINAIKRAYSEKVVQSQAAKHGWKLAWNTNTQGRRQAIVQRRG
jgi:hypothetical protein